MESGSHWEALITADTFQGGLGYVNVHPLMV